MGLFGFGSKGKSGGLMNIIRCDKPEYLVWKWRPTLHREKTLSDMVVA